MPGSFLILANPASGRGRGARTAEAVRALLVARGRSAAVRFTGARGHAAEMTRTALDDPEPPSVIVVCGGDGTIQEVAGTLAELRAEGVANVPALGLAPAGRCNDLARVFDITRDPAQIAEVLAEGMPRPLDLGRVNGRWFCTVATLGIDAAISSHVDRMTGPLRGTPAYLYGAVRVLMRYTPPRLRLAGDFGTIDEPLFLASTANTACYGGAIRIAPGASPIDGLLNVCVVSAVSRWRGLRLLPVFVVGRHLSLPEVRFFTTRSLSIEAETPQDIWADGERLTTTPATLEVAPAAVNVVLDPAWSATENAGPPPPDRVAPAVRS